jgi:hypothetical protein
MHAPQGLFEGLFLTCGVEATYVDDLSFLQPPLTGLIAVQAGARAAGLPMRLLLPGQARTSFPMTDISCEPPPPAPPPSPAPPPVMQVRKEAPPPPLCAMLSSSFHHPIHTRTHTHTHTHTHTDTHTLSPTHW